MSCAALNLFYLNLFFSPFLTTTTEEQQVQLAFYQSTPSHIYKSQDSKGAAAVSIYLGNKYRVKIIVNGPAK